MGEIIPVGMAEYKLVRPPDQLITAGLGSCIGICLLDPRSKIASLCHIMLPCNNDEKRSSKPAKYADTGIAVTVAAMEAMGADTRRLVAKIAGGAQMFRFSGENDLFKIGERNVIAVEKNLEKHRIALLSKDVGGHVGRTIIFNPANGDLLIRTIKAGEKVI